VRSSISLTTRWWNVQSSGGCCHHGLSDIRQPVAASALLQMVISTKMSSQRLVIHATVLYIENLLHTHVIHRTHGLDKYGDVHTPVDLLPRLGVVLLLGHSASIRRCSRQVLLVISHHWVTRVVASISLRHFPRSSPAHMLPLFHGELLLQRMHAHPTEASLRIDAFSAWGKSYQQR